VEGLKMDTYLHNLTTEEVNGETLNIDQCSTEEMLALINDQDLKVPLAVRKEIPNIARAVDMIYESIKNGGRMFYIGAGTSGRLGVLDASECPPTFGTDPELIQGIIAGGDMALRIAIEGGEDNVKAGEKVIEEYSITNKDVIVGITASGSAPYVLAALKAAKAKGTVTIGVTNNKNSKLAKVSDVCIAPVVGPEVIIGSTRMKSGTAQKLVLNMLTTSVMIKLGKTYGNLMVDLKATNIKLNDRARRIICHATGVDYETAGSYLEQVNGDTKLAIIMIITRLDAVQGRDLLKKYNGRLKDAIEAVKVNTI
jgi:N-acetylmuramic acid 6-phosphate etherase